MCLLIHFEFLKKKKIEFSYFNKLVKLVKLKQILFHPKFADPKLMFIEYFYYILLHNTI